MLWGIAFFYTNQLIDLPSQNISTPLEHLVIEKQKKCQSHPHSYPNAGNLHLIIHLNHHTPQNIIVYLSSRTY